MQEPRDRVGSSGTGVLREVELAFTEPPGRSTARAAARRESP